MNRLSASLGSWLLALSIFLPGAVVAQDMIDAENEAIHTVVQSQLQAFASDDADTAFELASDETQALIGSPQALLGIVRELYPPLHRPQKAVFAPADVEGDHAIQEVAITDMNNVIWIAVFLMQQDEESHWKICSYHLVETTSVEI